MAGFFNKKFFIRTSAAVSSAVLSALPIVFSDSVGIPDSIFLGFFCGLCALTAYPITFETARTAVYHALAIEIPDLILELVFLRSDILVVAVVGFNTLALTALTLWTSIGKFKRVKSLFRQKAVLVAAQEHYRLVMRLTVLALALLFLSASGVNALKLACAVLSVALYSAFHYSLRADRILLMSRSREKVMRELILGNLRSIPDVSADEDARMSMLYARVTNYMENNRPYLHETYTVKELASSVFSNRSYLSKTINYFSGKNFNQFVNYYRVKYAIELMKKDTNMKMLEVATLSGFHSVVTFNMAFRMYTDTTPAAYRERLRFDQKK